MEPAISMKTDTLFHELFQLAPQALFELLQIKPGCAYRFESPVVKASERRLDGLLEPVETGHSRYFVEVQGYDDRSIYWRVLHQIGLYHAQRPEIQGGPWQAVLLFLDEAYDPGPQQLGTLSDGPMPWLIRGVVPDLMQRITEPSPILHVLRPLIAENEAQMRQQAADWVQDIRQVSTLDRAEQERLLALLVQFILQKFSHLTSKEIGQMLKLTPIEETRGWTLGFTG
jgi:predicted transposase YdaD